MVAEPLKNSFGADVAASLAAMVAAVHHQFDVERFVADCAVGFEEMELTERARHISGVLAVYLPADRERAIDVIVASLGPEIEAAELSGMEVFRYLPFVFFVAEHGLDHFDAGMRALYEITKRFTSEAALRAFIERYPEQTQDLLREWATDENVHVRRLVSEGTRPRLPWAPRLRRFQDDPGPAIELLEMLKDDPAEYVRRSVSNNLNDISKDHPDLVVDIARRWMADTDDNRTRLVKHGLRTLVKQGHPGALDVLGYCPDTPVRVDLVRFEPAAVAIGGAVRISVELVNPETEPAPVLVDLIVHFVKASGATSPKVFKGAERQIGAGDATTVSKTISLRQHSTRTHYPGRHLVDVQINGTVHPGGEFSVTE